MKTELHAFQTSSLTELTANINNFLRQYDSEEYEGIQVEATFHYYDPIQIKIGSQERWVYGAIATIYLNDEEEI